MGHNKNYHYAYKEGFFPSKTPESVPCLEGHRRLGQIRDCLPIKIRIRSCTLAKKLHNSLLCLLQWVALVCAVTGLQKMFFSALRASFCSKHKREAGPPGPSPGSVTGLFCFGYPVKDPPVFLSGLPPGTRSSENSLQLLGSSFVSVRKSPALGTSTTLCI